VPRLRHLLVAFAVLALAIGGAACGDDDDDGENGGGEVSGVEALPDATCGDVEYGGEGEPGALIASDLPLQGDSAERSAQMNDAIRQELDGQGWKTGRTTVAFQACDDSIEETGEWDEATCRSNAEAYAANPDLIGVIGTYNSGCAAVMIPILNQAPGGGVAMVSPGNTLICLTERANDCEPGQPDSLYPSGTRNYARVVPNDSFQGSGLASFAHKQGVRKPFVLYAADDPTSKGQADTFLGGSFYLDMPAAGIETWDPEATDYTKLMRKVKASGADGLVLAGLLEQNGAQLIKDKVAVLGPNEGDGAAVQLFAPDGFAQQATIDDTGRDAAGMFVSVPGRLPEKLTGDGKTFVDELQAGLGDTPVELFAPYSAQAAQVLLSAMAPDPTRAATVEALTQVEVDKGITGTFTITPTGDPSLGPIDISVARDTFEFAGEETPSAPQLAFARGERGG
jgi:branched-chain amino acid transport system substrate-binding protein